MLFLRSLGLIYLTAFLSLWVQLEGLIGSRGILPAANFLEMVRSRIGIRPDLFPTLCWFNSSDLFLHFLCGGGVFFSLLVVGSWGRYRAILTSLSLFLLWLFYLSLVTVSQDFLSFQWDNLLLEAGFLGTFLAMGKEPSRLIIFLLRWLLFRLMFESGCVKLLSGDPTWKNLTTLTFHYETQPLPTWIGWYAHQLPIWFQKASCAVMFFIELVVPFSVFAPRKIRLVGCAILVGFQVLIFLTGNYCFFNLLTIALCVLLLEDATSNPPLPPLSKGGKGGFFILASVILLVSTLQLFGMFLGRRNLPQPFSGVLRIAAPFRTVNNYGLFAVMTTRRLEIIVEGSDDGEIWKAYEFKYKPGDLKWRPSFVAPHQPRLDWQMWFAALERCGESPWFMNFIGHLFKGTPEVLELLASNPFRERPPVFIRAVGYDYHFTDWRTKRVNGTWWKRELRGLYCPIFKVEK